MNSFSLNGSSNNFTLISNNFIDHYMLVANGEYVKVYLLLLRKLRSNIHNLSTSLIADQLNLMESDVLRAFKYWEQKQVIQLSITNGQISEIQLLSLDQSTSDLDLVSCQPIEDPLKESPTEKTPSRVITESFTPKSKPSILTKPTYTNKQIQAFSENESFQELIMVAEKFLGHLSQPDLTTLISLHDWLGLPINVIDILLDYCVSNNHRNMRYIEKVALDWAEKKIDTTEKAKTQTEVFNKHYYMIKKALGQGNINPVDHEIKLMNKWLNQFSFDIEVILEACNRTMQHAPAGGFKYTDSILESWNKKQVKHIEDIKKLDNIFSLKKSSKNVTNKPSPSYKNKFTDYDQRVYDFDKLEKKAIELLHKGDV